MISFQYGPDRHTRLLACERVVPQSVTTMWNKLHMLQYLIRSLKFVERVDVVDHDERDGRPDDGASGVATKRFRVALCFSKTLRLRTSFTLCVRFHDATHTVELQTEDDCRWVNYTATIALSDDAPSSKQCRVVYESVLSDISIDASIVAPILDGKLQHFTEAVVGALLRDDMGAEWVAEFHEAFEPVVMEALRAAGGATGHRDVEDVEQHLSRLAEYTMQGGKYWQALLVRFTMECELRRELTAEELRSAHVAGWCVEAMQAMALVADDIVDGSSTRRGKPCWYKVVGQNTAITDSLTLYAWLFQILRCHFTPGGEAGEAGYAVGQYGDDTATRLWSVMTEACMRTCLGQTLDTFSERCEPARATASRYDQIVLNKTSYYTFYAPIAMGAILAAETANAPASGARADLDARIEQVRHVASLLGNYFQVQDDYLDVYGGAATGKVGTDIADCKLTWLYCWAQERCDPEQRAAFGAHYGTEAGVERIKALLDDLDVHEEYSRREKAAVRECLAAGDACGLGTVCFGILAKMGARTK